MLQASGRYRADAIASSRPVEPGLRSRRAAHDGAEGALSGAPGGEWVVVVVRARRHGVRGDGEERSRAYRARRHDPGFRAPISLKIFRRTVFFHLAQICILATC